MLLSGTRRIRNPCLATSLPLRPMMPLPVIRPRRLEEGPKASATSVPTYIEHNDARLRNASRSRRVAAHSMREIAWRTGVHRSTVRRILNGKGLHERNPRKYERGTDPFEQLLRRRWKEGCHNAKQLARELRREGFTGSYYMVRRRVAAWRSGEDPPLPRLIHGADEFRPSRPRGY